MDANTIAREIFYVSASINEFERLLTTDISSQDRVRAEESLASLLDTQAALRKGLEQLLSVETTQKIK